MSSASTAEPSICWRTPYRSDQKYGTKTRQGVTTPPEMDGATMRACSLAAVQCKCRTCWPLNGSRQAATSPAANMPEPKFPSCPAHRREYRSTRVNHHVQCRDQVLVASFATRSSGRTDIKIDLDHRI